MGNGDILTVNDALNMLKQTNCDSLMIGRGSVANPFIFHQIKAHFANTTYTPTWEALYAYLQVFLSEMPEDMTMRGKINKMKQLFGFIFKSKPALLELRSSMLTYTPASLADFLEATIPLLYKGWTAP